jgi:hypothetical protein
MSHPANAHIVGPGLLLYLSATARVAHQAFLDFLVLLFFLGLGLALIIRHEARGVVDFCTGDVVLICVLIVSFGALKGWSGCRTPTRTTHTQQHNNNNNTYTHTHTRRPAETRGGETWHEDKIERARDQWEAQNENNQQGPGGGAGPHLPCHHHHHHYYADASPPLAGSAGGLGAHESGKRGYRVAGRPRVWFFLEMLQEELGRTSGLVQGQVAGQYGGASMGLGGRVLLIVL